MPPAYTLHDRPDPYALLQELCGHRWDSHVLTQLAQAARPLRRADLAAAISHTGEHISDGQLARTIRRLTRRQLVHADNHGNRVYRLTPAGRSNADLLALVCQALVEATNGHHPHSSPPGRG